MKTVVYADVYFLLNFSIDLICLYICGAIAGKAQRKLPLIIAASIGGVYACAALFIRNSIVTSVSAVVVCLAIYFLAYRPNSFGGIIYGGLLLFCVNALFGGLYSSIVSFASGGRVDTDHFSYYPFFLAVTAALVFARFINLKATSEIIYSEITYNGKSSRFLSIIDTGNSLREPISGMGVALLCKSSAQKIFSEDEIRILSGDDNGSDAFMRGFRLIKLNTAVGSKRCFCVKAEKVFVEKRRKRSEVCVYLVVSSQLTLGDVECLLPNSLNFDL